MPRGDTRAGMAYAAGEDIDQIDLALSVVGLGATAAVLAFASAAAAQDKLKACFVYVGPIGDNGWT